MKKVFAILLSAMLMLSLAVPAMAADIIVENAAAGETYTAYQIFNVSISGENYAYTMAANSPWRTAIDAYSYNSKDVFTLTPSANDKNVLVVTVDADFAGLTDAADLATYLSKRIPADAANIPVTANDSGVAEFKNLAAGYYFVDTTLGSLCALFTMDDNAVLKEKNTIPGLTKTENKDTLEIGDSVTYTITVTDSKGTDKALTVHDKMEDGLTLNETTNDEGADTTFTISVTDASGDADTVSASDYTVKYDTECTDDCTFEIVFNADFVAKLDEGDQIVIVYSATLNEKAEISTETNDNTAWLKYSEQITQEVTVKASTFMFDLDKTDKDGNALSGAKFKLYDAQTGGNEVPVVFVSDGLYRVAKEGETGVEIATTAKGQVTIKGLDAKEYWLEETAAPAGYNPLTERKKVDLSGKTNLVRGTDDEGSVTYGLQVINNAGVTLPETGGMGTTIFYIVGGVMVAAAVVLLITKKRMSAEG